MNLDVLDAYSDVTDLEQLKEFSAKPLRKSIRVNTLLKTVEEFTSYAALQQWALIPVPWCPEGFYLERADLSEALGKDLWHQLGYFYIQEASSMLPVAMLNPQPGEMILDMSAAPGSKTTQISAAMQNDGIIIANDIQPKRLKTLQAATYRLGVTNAVLTQKKGQWFAEHMSERFDRVLCDAPCSAQGTIRKDIHALEFFRQESVAAMAKVQLELLESAIHATKVDGRIVYSTCTLTFEENELIIEAMCKKYPNALTVVDPHTAGSLQWPMEQGIKDAYAVQNHLQIEQKPMVRLWPQTHNSEGFFVAVLQKTASTYHGKKVSFVPRRERSLSNKVSQDCTRDITEQFGTNFIQNNESLFGYEGIVYLAHDYARTLRLPLKNYSLGIPYGKLLKNNTIRLLQDVARLRGAMAVRNTIELNDEQFTELKSAKNSICDASLSGDVVVQYNGYSLGLCKAMNGVLKNNLPSDLLG